jgi:hypothetical protein
MRPACQYIFSIFFGKIQKFSQMYGGKRKISAVRVGRGQKTTNSCELVVFG